MSRSDEQRIADILDACHEIATVVQIRAASAVPEPVLLACRRAAPGDHR